MKTKGQAAMEFLMTYGWAILAAIIVIGVLAIYFRPSTLTSNSVIVTAPLYGVGVAYGAGGTEPLLALTERFRLALPLEVLEYWLQEQRKSLLLLIVIWLRAIVFKETLLSPILETEALLAYSQPGLLLEA